jgi:hypothetical protein
VPRQKKRAIILVSRRKKELLVQQKNIWLPWVAPYSACSVIRQSVLPNMDVIRGFSRDLAMEAKAEHFAFK